MQMPLRETRAQIYHDEQGQVQGGQRVFAYQPFSTTDLLNWKQRTPSYTEKPQALIDLMQSIFLTHNSIWPDCQQLLYALFNTEEPRGVTQATLQWLDNNAPEGKNDEQFPETDPEWGPNEAEELPRLQRCREVLLNGIKAGGKKAINIGKVSEVLQKADESPGQFYEKLCEAYRLYIPFDPEAAENQHMLNTSFVGQA
ncbi:hypothetical protein AAY473_029564 [Plecturocebus cupreus]